MLLVDKDTFHIVDANPAAANYYGYSLAQLKEMKISEINLMSPVEIAEKIKQAALRNENAFLFPHRLASGEIRQVEVYSTPIRVGQKEQLLSIIHDVTERVRLETELKTQEEKMQSIIIGSRVGTWEWNVQTGEFDCNEQWAEIAGYTKTELQPISAETWKKLIHPEDLDRNAKLLQKNVWREEGYFSEDARLKHKNGHWIWIYICSSVKEWDSNGQPLKMIGTHIDITHRKQSEEALKRNAEIQSVLREIAEAAAMSQSMEKLYATIHRLINRVLPVENFHIALLDEASRQLEVVYLEDKDMSFPKKRPLAKGLTEYALSKGSTVHVTSGELERLQESGEVILPSIIPIHDWMGAPLLNTDRRAFGIMAMFFKNQTQSFQPGDSEVLSIIAAQVSMAIERKQAETKLRESEENKRNILQSTMDGFWLIDGNGYILDVNKAYCTMSGYAQEELQGLHITDIIADEDPETTAAIVARIRADGLARFEGRHRRKDGSIFDIEMAATLLANKNGQMIGFCRNITERKQAEEALRESEANFLSFFNTIEDFLFVLDEEGHILHVNQTVLDRLEYTETELVGRSVLEVHPEPRRAEAGQIVEKMLVGTADSCLIPLLSKSGELIPVETRVTTGAWNGRPALFGVSKDISALKISEEKLTKVFQATSALMAISTLEEGIYLDVNDTFLHTLGFEREEVIGKRSTDLNIFQDAEYRNKLRQTLLREGSVRNLEVKLWNRSGETLFGLFSAEIVEVAAYRLLITTMNDVTELKRTEESLRESEDRFTLSMEATKDGLWDLDTLTGLCYFSPGYYHMLGYEDGAFPTEVNRWTDLLHPEDLASVLQVNEDCSEGRNKSFEIEFRLRTRDGDWRWILSRGKSVTLDGQGRALRMVGTHIDITERKQAEEALQYSVEIQSVLREIAETAITAASLDEMYWAIHRLIGQILSLQQLTVNLLDKAANEIVVPFNAGTVTFVPARRPVGKGLTEYVMRLGRAVRFTPAELDRLSETSEYTLAKEQNAQARHYLGTPLIDSNGKPFGVLSLNLSEERQAYRSADVEVLSIIAAQVSMAIERKQTEKELETLAARFNLATRAGGIGVWEYDFVNKVLFWDDQMFALYGADKNDFTGAFEFWQTCVHPEDRERNVKEIQMALSGETEFDVEFRVCWPDGNVRHIRAVAGIDRDDSGQLLRVTGTSEDVTKFKQAEEIIRSAKMRYQALLEQSFEGMALVDVETQEVVEVNRRFTEILGYSLPNDAPLYVKSFIMDSPGKIDNIHHAIMQQQNALPQEVKNYRHKNGSIVAIERAGTVITIDGRKFLLGTMHDLTTERRRQAEVMRDVELACRAQRELLPKVPESPLVCIRTHYYPSHLVSGDSYYLQWQEDGTVLRGFLIDVSGHGVATALQTASIVALLREAVVSHLSLSEQVQWVNSRAEKYFAEGSYATLLGFELDFSQRQLQYVGAGISRFYINGREILTPGMFVGIFEAAAFDEGVIPIAAGDCLHFLTDGFTDAIDKPENAGFWSLCGKDFEVDVASLRRLAESGKLSDDATGVCLKIRELL